MTDPIKPAAIRLPDDFVFGEVLSAPRTTGAITPPPSLGPLADFVGTWAGTGFNTIFRPDNSVTPTVLPVPVSSDNILELNLTTESLSFSPSLGSVPNRGTNPQGDIFLNGVPYLQAIDDVTTGQKTGIHLEPGLWILVPSTTHPDLGVTVARMASIPHGTTINAQGTSRSFSGAPTIPTVDITPFGGTPTSPGGAIRFPSQTAIAAGTARIPQDLTSFIAAGTITQAILDDPNTILRNIIQKQRIISTTVLSVATNPNLPLFGGGTSNIAFLLGDTAAAAPNAQDFEMVATFWIETVQVTIPIPIFKPGQVPLAIAGAPSAPGGPAPIFSGRPPGEITTERTITVTFKQIQYSQTVFLVFNGLTWPHVSVATLVPANPIPIPPTAWA